MATAADSSSSNHHSPSNGLNSPQFRRRNLPSAWAHVVRGDPELGSAVLHSPLSPSRSSSPPPIASMSEQAPFFDCSPSKPASSSSSPRPDSPVAADFTDSNKNSGAVQPKKPAWKKPVNGVVDVGPVMGADSWPALSKSATTSPKVSADLSSKASSDGLVSTPQGHGSHHSAQKQATSNANPNSVPNRAAHGRQRSSKRGGGSSSGGGAVHSGFSHAPAPAPAPALLPPFPVLQMPPNSYGAFVPAVLDPIREPQYRGNNMEGRHVGAFVSHSHTGSDQWHSSRRSNNGPRGDGGYHNKFGGRRDQDRRSYNNARDAHNQMQPQRNHTRGFARPPPSNAHTFVPPLPVTAFVNPIGYVQDYVYFSPFRLETLGPMPLVPSPSPSAILMPHPDHLLTMLVNQIEYYFSNENLVKDEFLKSNMDENGWVPISLIAGFPRVKSLTNNIEWILESLRSSSVLVEVQGDKVRRRNDWMKWITNGRVTAQTGLSSHTESSSEILATSFGRMSMEEGTADHSSGDKGRPLSEGTLEGHSFELNGKNSEDPSLC